MVMNQAYNYCSYYNQQCADYNQQNNQNTEQYCYGDYNYNNPPQQVDPMQMSTSGYASNYQAFNIANQDKCPCPYDNCICDTIGKRNIVLLFSKMSVNSLSLLSLHFHILRHCFRLLAESTREIL